MKAWQAAAVLALALVAFTAVRSPRGGAPAAAGDAPGLLPRAQQVVERAPELRVAFRLDPALTRSLYMGERWVSPPVFEFAQPGDRFIVHAKAQSFGRDGEATDLVGNWTASDPGMVGISRGHGEVTLEVREPGESTVTVATGAGSRTLHVRARRTPDGIQAAFSQ